jgi:hypothetical protein
MWSSAPYPSPLLQCSDLLSVYFSRVCLLEVCIEISSLLLPLLWCTYSTPTPSSACPFQFLVYYPLFFVLFCLQSEGQTVQGAMLVCPRGSCGNTTCRLFAHLLVYVSQADFELASGGTGALLFSKYDMAWSSF